MLHVDGRRTYVTESAAQDTSLCPCHLAHLAILVLAPNARRSAQVAQEAQHGRQCRSGWAVLVATIEPEAAKLQRSAGCDLGCYRGCCTARATGTGAAGALRCTCAGQGQDTTLAPARPRAHGVNGMWGRNTLCFVDFWYFRQGRIAALFGVNLQLCPRYSRPS